MIKNFNFRKAALFMFTFLSISVFGTTGKLITSESELHAGDYFIIGSTVEKKTFAAGVMGTNIYFSSVEATLFENEISSDDAILVKLGGKKNEWTLSTSEGLVGVKNAKSLVLNDGKANSTWLITFTGNNAIIQSTTSDYGEIKYNSKYTRFLNYTTSYIDLKNVQLYKVDIPKDTVLVTGVSLHMDSIELFVTDKITLNAQIYPDNATFKGVTWQSLDNSIAKVDKGVVTTFSKGGVVDIIVTTKDGGFSDTCTIIVKEGETVAANCIVYFASEKLQEVKYSSDATQSGVKCYAFKTSLTNHTFSNGRGVLKFNDNLTTVGESAFRNCSNIDSIYLPSTIQRIEEYAFSDCESLKQIKIGNKLNFIGREAFSNCSSLKSIVIPELITEICNDCFAGCSSLTNVFIGNSVKKIGDRAFHRCKELSTIYIPDSVKIIGEMAFRYDSALSAVVIGDNVDSIKDYAFRQCTSLSSITFGKGVKSIGIAAFYSCQSLTSVKFNKNLKSIGDYAFQFCNEISNISFNDSIISIGKFAFGNCEKLSEISIPYSVTSIGEYAFEECNAIKHVFWDAKNCNGYNFGSQVETLIVGDKCLSISSNFCSGMERLHSVIIGESVKIISGDSFDGCKAIRNVIWKAKDCNAYNFGSQVESYKFGGNVEVIPSGLCSNMDKLDSIIIPNSVKIINTNAFNKCYGLYYISIGDSVQKIYSSAFSFCRGCTSIFVPNNISYIGPLSFQFVNNIEYYGTCIDNDWAANSVNGYVEGYTVYESVEKEYLLGCSTVKADGELVIPLSVKEICHDALFLCSLITSINLGNVQKIGDCALLGCTSLNSITLPRTLEKLGDRALLNCSNLKSITSYATHPVACDNTFNGIDKSIPVYVPEGSLDWYRNAAGWKEFSNIQIIKQANNVILYTAEEKLFEVTSSLNPGLHINAFNVSIQSHEFSNGQGIITFDSDVTSIGDDAFRGADIISIDLPASITSIGAVAFQGSSLKYISIPSSVTTFGTYPFEGCDNLPVVDNIRYADSYLVEVVNDSVTYNIRSGTKWIGTSAFCDWSLEYLDIPDGVISIEDFAFYYCYRLSSISLPNSLIHIGEEAFRGCNSLSTINIPNSVETIGTRPFIECTSLPIYNNLRYADTYLVEAVKKTLSTYSIKGETRWIGSEAFSELGSLTSITLPNSVKYIQDFAFYHCSSLSSVSFSEKLKNIETAAFFECISLKSVELGHAVENIGESAFSECENISFISCKTVIPPICGNYCFRSVNKSIPLYVPNISINDYKIADEWRDFMYIQALPTAVEECSYSGNKEDYNGKFVNDSYIYIIKDGIKYGMTGNRL